MSEQKWETYLFEYSHGGHDWTISFRAASVEDAKARLASIGRGRFVGTLVARVPAVGPDIFADFLCWLGAIYSDCVAAVRRAMGSGRC